MDRHARAATWVLACATATACGGDGDGDGDSDSDSDRGTSEGSEVGSTPGDASAADSSTAPATS